MSTKALEEALDYLENNPTADEAQDARRRARAELEVIRKAALDLSRLSIGDYTYDVRDRRDMARDIPGDNSGWFHPDVKAWSDASTVINEIAKESK
jgi:hypothetical protein